MATEAEIIAAAIAEARATADVFITQVDRAADRALDLSEGRTRNVGYWGYTPEITAIEPDVPAVDDSLLTYDSQLNNLVGLMSSELAGYFNKYYPLASDAFDEATNWLVNTITNGGTGIPKEIEDQIWQRARDRIIKDGQRVANSITSGYSARGFSLPQGPMIYDLNQARLEGLSKTGEASTAIATKQAEIQIETMKFAIGAAIDSRFKAMNAASDYIRAMMSAPDAASKLASINTDAKAKMIAATADLYRARLTRDQLVIGSQDSRRQSSVQFNVAQMSAYQAEIDGNVSAAQVAADAYAKIGQAYIAQFNGVVSSSASSFA